MELNPENFLIKEDIMNSQQHKLILWKDLKEGNVYDHFSFCNQRRENNPFLLLKLEKRESMFVFTRLFKDQIKESTFYNDDVLYYVQLN